MTAVVSWWAWLGAVVAVVLLVWQWRRARGDRWRQFGWLVAVAAWCVLLSPSWLPRWPQTLAPIAIVTPGNADTVEQAEAWAQQQRGRLIHLSALPTELELRALQQNGEADWQLFGHGFLPSVWAQLSPRTVYWQAPPPPPWQLQYDSTVRSGERVNFVLDAPANASQAELRDSRNAIVATVPVQAGRAEWSWRPATSGRYDWSVVVTGADTATLNTIPVAIAVQPSSTQLVRGHFAAPSFEQRALRQWLEQAGFSGEFVSTMGPSLQRRDRFGDAADAGQSRAAMQLLSLRAWQQANDKQRRSWLNDAAVGSTLVLLADGSENDAALRAQLSRELAIAWRERSEAELPFTQPELVLQRSRWHPQADGAWQSRIDAAEVQVRNWQQGQLIWIGLLDSHRWWARQPLAYAEWWQRALQGQRSAAANWLPPSIGSVGRFAALCIDNAEPAMTTLTIQLPDGRQQSLPLQADSWPGRACAYFAPQQSGWYDIVAPVTGVWRVLPTPAPADADAWAARAATARHTEAPAPLSARTQWQPLPRWPFFLLWLLALTLIWWRELRSRAGFRTQN